VTLGRLGALARSRRGTTTSAAALNVRVRQVQGEGSVFSAALIHARGTGADLGSSLRYA
jgi:sugar/nucleoside kinase (ribokinase family)